MNKLNNNKIIIAGVAVVVLWIITAAITFDRTFIPLKNYIGKNSKIILEVSVINDDLTQTGSLIKRNSFLRNI